MIFGLPLTVWLGIAAFIAMITTALIAILNEKGIHFIPFKYHHPCAITAAILATIHVAFAFGAILGL